MNYEELCMEFGTEVDYYHKRRQLESIRKLADIIEISKGNYQIIRKYSEVEKIERNKSMKKNRAYIEPLLYTYLGMQESTILVARMSQLLEQLQCVNDDYYTIKFNTQIAQDMIDDDKYGLSLFMTDSEPQLKQIVYDVLRDMKNRSLIDIEYLPTVSKTTHTKDGEILHPLTILPENDRHLFLEAQRVALEELGYERLTEVKFFDFGRVKKIIAKELGCSFVCYTYKITINTQGLSKYVLEDFYGMRSSFNKYISNKIKSDEKHYKYLDDTEKDLYIDYCISVEGCRNIKESIKSKKKELLENKSY